MGSWPKWEIWIVVKKRESIPSGWKGMRKGMKAGVSKLYVGDGQGDKLGWTSLTTLGILRDIHTYYSLCFTVLPTHSLGLSLDILPSPASYTQPSLARCSPGPLIALSTFSHHSYTIL